MGFPSPTWTVHTKYAGLYGGETPAMLSAKERLESGTVEADGPTPWICPTFVGKTAAAMLDYAETHPNDELLLWCTKSLVQPHGPADSWEKSKQMPDAVREWLRKSGFKHGSHEYMEHCTMIS